MGVPIRNAPMRGTRLGVIPAARLGIAEILLADGSRQLSQILAAAVDAALPDPDFPA